MDESYLTGEPFQITKTAGSLVISGAINGETALTIRTTKLAADSRYAKIMKVMHESESKRPHLQRLGDQLGAIYTPVALVVALLACFLSSDSLRFLSVLVIATPCPPLLGIPIAIISSISLCARRAIIVKSPVVLKQIAGCRTAILAPADRWWTRMRRRHRRPLRPRFALPRCPASREPQVCESSRAEASFRPHHDHLRRPRI